MERRAHDLIELVVEGDAVTNRVPHSSIDRRDRRNGSRQVVLLVARKAEHSLAQASAHRD